MEHRKLVACQVVFEDCEVAKIVDGWGERLQEDIGGHGGGGMALGLGVTTPWL